MKVWRGLLLAALAAAVIGVPAAVADSPNGLQANGVRIGGLVPTLAGGAVTPSIPALGGGNLIWHGGNVMQPGNKVYAIFWKPAGQTMSSSYKTLIKQYFQDVAADSGLSTNVYFSDTQYTDSRGHIKYLSHFGGAFADTQPFPANGCVDSVTTICLSDAQLRAEINRVITVKGWVKSPKNEFFIFTPKNVGSCFGGGPSSCAFTAYCAYHGAEGSGSSIMIYANMPYAGGNANCDEFQHPNGNDADGTINVTSHEHNESITDPDVSTGYYDNQGFEDGDKCAWIFGPVSGPGGAEYNQTINGHHYFMQEEWSNQTTRCVQTGL
jgi:serine protease